MTPEETREYKRNHARVTRLWGAKASHWQCVLCFDPATAWAHLWRTHPDPTDSYGYAPMCWQDHWDYDHEQRAERSRKQWEDPEFRAAQSEKARRQWQDPEFRERMKTVLRTNGSRCGAAMKKRWQDPEYKANMSATASERGKRAAATRLWKQGFL